MYVRVCRIRSKILRPMCVDKRIKNIMEKMQNVGYFLFMYRKSMKTPVKINIISVMIENFILYPVLMFLGVSNSIKKLLIYLSM